MARKPFLYFFGGVYMVRAYRVLGRAWWVAYPWELRGSKYWLMGQFGRFAVYVYRKHEGV